MPVQPSKLVTDRQKSSLSVQAVREQLESVASALVVRFPAAVQSAAKAAVLLISTLLLDWLAAATTAMIAADHANAVELGDDADVRAPRDASAAEVSEKLADLRDVLRTCFGEGPLPSFGLTGTLPTDPVVLHRAGQAVLVRLREFVAPAPRLRSIQFDNAEWIELLETPVATLGVALEEVAKDRKQNELTLGEKNRAVEAYDFAFRATANVLMGLFVAAGRDDLAARVRPSARRAGQTAEDAPSPPSGEGTADDKSPV